MSSTLYVLTQQSYVQLDSERLTIHPPRSARDGVVHQVHLADVARVVLSEQVQITTQAACKLLRMNIPICYMDAWGRVLGTAFAPLDKQAEWRMLQHGLSEEGKWVMAKELIIAKLKNQRRLMMRLSSRRNEIFTEPVEMKQASVNLENFGKLETLRGNEGIATKCWFERWSSFLPAGFEFVRRSARPPLNEANSLISYGAHLIYQEAIHAVHKRGLDAGVGLLHVTQNGRYSLALDLMEPFRPALVEALALTVLVRGILKKEHFERKNGGVYLNTTGRKIYLEQYERRMQQKFKPYSQEGVKKTSLREQIEEQVILYKQALRNPESFVGFRLP